MEKLEGYQIIQPIEVWRNIVKKGGYSFQISDILDSWQYEKDMVEEEWNRLKNQQAQEIFNLQKLLGEAGEVIYFLSLCPPGGAIYPSNEMLEVAQALLPRIQDAQK